VKRLAAWLLAALVLAGCTSLDSIPYSPAQTSETWLKIQPFIEFQVASKTIILVQPSTTVIVTFLGIVAITAGLYFLRLRNGQKSRYWWGVALILWGAGALFAGTSYEAFSYQIKCVGRASCLWTSGWEICYLVLSVSSVDAMLVAVAHSCTTGKWRKNLIRYAAGNFGIYLIVVMIGTIAPIKFLISFEMLILVSAPNILFFLALNSWRFSKRKLRMDLVLLGTWIWLIITIGAYFLYYLSGMTQQLWKQGIWFSENDVLHIGLIIWMVYIVLGVAHHIQDEPAQVIMKPANETGSPGIAKH